MRKNNTNGNETRQLHVLCIDDDPNLLNAIARNLRWANIKVSSALNGLQGIWMATTIKPDLIITDLKMPLGNGEDVIDCIVGNQTLAHIPIFVLTGVSEPGIDKQLCKRGAKAVFHKPFDIQTLVDAIADHLPVEEQQPVSNVFVVDTRFPPTQQPSTNG